MIWVFIIATSVYIIFLLVCILAWHTIPKFIPDGKQPQNSISVLIPARNESENILAILNDLQLQTYPNELFEVVVIDDHSEDKTAKLVLDFQGKSSMNLKLVSLFETDMFGKKAALKTGIKIATGKLIITTDADCRIGNNYLKTVEAFYREKNLKMITGPVALYGSDSVFTNMQSIEFSSLIGSGAASLQLGFASMCNGANLIYEKEVFERVGGFSGNEDIASGDDEFLYHKVVKKYPGKVAFLKNSDALVFTLPANSLVTFINQRKRWASKWSHYRNKAPKVLAVFIFLSNVFILIGSVLIPIFNSELIVILGAFIVLKIVLEYVFLGQIMKFSKLRFNTVSFLLLQIIYPLYVSFIGIFSKSGKYLWKGREQF